ncbi:hypothetical protein BS17DRAFT_763981 [Gyrodon lividus]|nr:hypothetical protein BS17DRAFT_763981 [Gyrodon lividus]
MWGMSTQATPSAKTQDPPNMESSTIAADKPVQSSSQGLKLHIPPARSCAGTASNMEAGTSNIPSTPHLTYHHTAPPASAPQAPHNMGLIPGATYTLSGNPLVSHQEHHAAMQQMEAMEVENHELHGLVTRALACIKVLEQGMASLGRICEVTWRTVATSPIPLSSIGMQFPFEQVRTCIPPNPPMPPQHPCHQSPCVMPAIIQSTTPDTARSMPWTDATAIPRARSSPPNLEVIPASPISIRQTSVPPIAALADMECPSDNIESMGTPK